MKTLAGTRSPCILLLLTFAVGFVACIQDDVNQFSSTDGLETVTPRSCTRSTVSGEDLALNEWDAEWDDNCEHFNTTTGELNRLIAEQCYAWQLPVCSEWANVTCFSHISTSISIDLEDPYTESEQDDMMDELIDEASAIAAEFSCMIGHSGHKFLIDAFFWTFDAGGGNYTLLLDARIGCCIENS